MTSSKKWGVCCLIVPILGLMFVLLAWALTSFIIGQMAAPLPYSISQAPNGTVAQTIALGQPDARETAARIINVALGFLGIVFVLMIPIGLVVGIVLLAKKDKQPQVAGAAESAGQSDGTSNVQPSEKPKDTPQVPSNDDRQDTPPAI